MVTKSTPFPKAANNGQYMKQQFKTLDTRQWKTVKPEDEKDKMSPVITICQLTALREFSSHDAGKGTQVEPSKLPELRKQSWDSERSKRMETTGLSARGESCTERELQRCAEGPPWVFSWVLICPSMCRKYLRPGKESPKRISGNSAQSSHRVGNTACAHQADWNISWFMRHWVEYSERSCLSNGE